VCNACPANAQCTGSKSGRHIFRSFFQEYLDRAQTYHQTKAYRKALRKRSVWVEPLFGEAMEFHCLRRFRLRRLLKVNIEALMVASGQNLKRLIKHNLIMFLSSFQTALSHSIFPIIDFFNSLPAFANNRYLFLSFAGSSLFEIDF
jgi:hypothetical protein